jgi:F-type H+-transporting ATPase subunit gamma
VSGRVAQIGARIEGMRQLGAVVNAMRGIAAARAQQAHNQLTAVETYAATIAGAIGRALGLAPVSTASPPRRPGRLALVVFCAEQGFAGAFSERVLDGVGPDLSKATLFLVGARGVAIAAERGLAVTWSAPLPSHSPGIPKLADAVAQALYARIAAGEIDRLEVVFTQRPPGQGLSLQRVALFPFDAARFPPPKGADAPLVNLAPQILIPALTADYLHAELCSAALHAFAAENETRMETMAAARDQVGRELATLQARQRLVRQEEITAEVIELAAGEEATRQPRRKQ